MSKVLSNRDKWLRQEDRGSSPVKKVKGKKGTSKAVSCKTSKKPKKGKKQTKARRR